MKLVGGVLALALLALVAYELGSRRSAEPSSASRPAAPKTSAPQATPAPHAPASPAQRREMDRAAFWDLIADTRAAAGNDTGRQSQLLEQRLSALRAQQIVDFQRLRRGFDERAYTWDLWGAAYVIEDGCSEDCFRDFRGYLISLGRGPYEAALRDPDSLASIAQDPSRATGRTPTAWRGTPMRARLGRTCPRTTRISRAILAASRGTTTATEKRSWCADIRASPNGFARWADTGIPSRDARGAPSPDGSRGDLSAVGSKASRRRGSSTARRGASVRRAAARRVGLPRPDRTRRVGFRRGGDALFALLRPLPNGSMVRTWSPV
jgi:Protein of unknown function (DUF4240)